MSKTPDWLNEMWTQQASAVSDRDVHVWAIGDGDDEYHGTPEDDYVWLDGFTLAQLRQGLALETPGARPHVEGNGIVSFLDAAGQPCAVAGVLRIGGAQLRFTGVSRFAFLW